MYEEQTQVKARNVETHNVFIKDLYDRMLRWKILCRVVYARKFVSVKGKKCLAAYLIDKKGDQIKAMYYFDRNIHGAPSPLVEGKMYSISDGEVIQPPASANQSEKLPL